MIAVLLTTALVKDYLLNYARSLIYTTSLTFANIIAVNCSFDLLEDGAAETVGNLHSYHTLMVNAVRSQLATHLLALSTYFVDLLRTELKKYPSSLLSLPEHLTPVSGQASHPMPRQSRFDSPWENDPCGDRSWRHKASTARSSASRDKSEPPASHRSFPTPIIPILTPEPRALSSFLLSYTAPAPASAVAFTVIPDASTPSPDATLSTAVALLTKPIYPPTVPKGTARVRICLHAGHTREDVTVLAQGIVAWAEKRVAEEQRGKERWRGFAEDVGVAAWMSAKL